MRRAVTLIVLLLVFSIAGALLVQHYFSQRKDVQPSPSSESPGQKISAKPVFRVLDDSSAAKVVQGMSPLVQGIPSWTAFASPLETSLEYLSKRNQEATAVKTEGLGVSWGDLTKSMQTLLALLPALDANPALLVKKFKLFALEPGTLLTGYYEPWMEASLTRSEAYPYPLYGVPKDCKTVRLGQFHPRWKGQSLVYRINGDHIEPYPDRRAIDGEKVLKGKGAEIAFAKNLTDVFMLQVQGSGRLVLPDGSVRHILYAGKNGLPYVSIGRLLVKEGYVPQEEMSMERIREFIAKEPVAGRELMYRNPSYVFFRLSDEGPFGCIGRVLTPMVSVAVDRHYIPLGSALFLSGKLPRIGGGGERPFHSLVTAQDAGGAIQKTRCDLFCGTGPDAEYLAGHLQHDASLFLLVSKDVLANHEKHVVQ